MQKPFENAGALLNFLETDEPDRYVFRGQTHAYDGPMLPSGARYRFTPFNSSTNTSKWAGVSTPLSVIKMNAQTRWSDSSTQVQAREVGDNKEAMWDLPESDYQQGFCDFFNQLHSHQNRVVGSLMRESAIPAIGALMGKDLADLLCQQYGFTSVALDVSTNPSVAIFFSIHQAPFYSLVTDSSKFGVVYRWPRVRAMIAQDLLLPLEGSGFISLINSFHNFIKDSPDLRTLKDKLMRYTSVNSERQKWLMWILSEGERRSLNSLCFPLGAFNQSRMGRQCAALLFPDFEVVKPLESGTEGDICALVGDLLTTHEGEAFYFHHSSSVPLPKQINKFFLWPSIKSGTEYHSTDFKLESWYDHIKFEDIYLEMMLRFFSTCSPCDIGMAYFLESGNSQSIQGGLINSVVDLGYELQPSDAGLIVESMRVHDIHMPIPTLRHIPVEYFESFQSAFAKSKFSI